MYVAALGAGWVGEGKQGLPRGLGDARSQRLGGGCCSGEASAAALPWSWEACFHYCFNSFFNLVFLSAALSLTH